MSLATFATFTADVGFKDSSVAAQFEQVAPSVRAIILEVARFCKKQGFPPPVITSLIRAPGTLGVPNSLHFTGYAADMRLVDPISGTPYWNLDQETAIIKFLTGAWGSPRRVDTIKEGGTPKPGLPTTAPHIHFEVQVR